MQEKDIKNYKAFVSSVENIDYNSQHMLAPVVMWCLMVPLQLLIGINVLSIAGLIIAGLLLIPMLWIYLKKKKRHIFLFSCLRTSSGFISGGAVLGVNILLYCTSQYVPAMILTGGCFIVSVIVCYLQVRNRLKRNYYQTSQKSASGSGDPPYVGLSIGGAAVLGMVIAKVLPKNLANFGELLAFAVVVMCAIIVGYYGTEQLLLHIAVCKYDLEDAIRIRSDYEHRL